MSGLEIHELTDIVIAAEPGGIFEHADAALQLVGRTDLATNLMKLQQDAGLEMDPAFNPDDQSNPPGPQTAALWAAYQPVTRARYEGIFAAVNAALKPKPGGQTPHP